MSNPTDYPNLAEYLKGYRVSKWIQRNKKPTNIVANLLFLGSVVVMATGGPFLYWLGFFVAGLTIGALGAARGRSGLSALAAAAPEMIGKMLARWQGKGSLNQEVDPQALAILEASAQAANRALRSGAAIRMFGPKLPPAYNETLKDTSKLVEGTMERAFAELQGPLMFKSSYKNETFAALEQIRGTLEELSAEMQGLSEAIRKTPADTEGNLRSTLGRLKALREVEEEIAQQNIER